MRKVYETTLEILKIQKQDLIDQLKGKKTNILDVQSIIEKICFFDNKNEEYTKIIINQSTKIIIIVKF